MIDIAGGIILAVIGLCVLGLIAAAVFWLLGIPFKIMGWLYDSPWGRALLAVGWILGGLAVIHFLTPQ